MEVLRAVSLGQYFILPDYSAENTGFFITAEKSYGFDEKSEFYSLDYNCKIKLGERRAIQTYINPKTCRIGYFNANTEPSVYILEPAKLSETKTGYCIDAIRFLKEHDISFSLIEKEEYHYRRKNSDGEEREICAAGKFYAGKSAVFWEEPEEYTLEALFFKKQLILDGEPIRKIWIPEYNYTNDIKYICADHTETERFIRQLYETPMEMTKEAFKQQLLANDTLGIIIVYTWDGKRYDLINLQKEAVYEATKTYEKNRASAPDLPSVFT